MASTACTKRENRRRPKGENLFGCIYAVPFTVSTIIMPRRPVLLQDDDPSLMDASTGPGSAGLRVTQEMQKILNQPDQYLTSDGGGQKLRRLYVQRRSIPLFN